MEKIIVKKTIHLPIEKLLYEKIKNFSFQPKKFGLNLSALESNKLHPHPNVKVGCVVKQGQPLVYHEKEKFLLFFSPVSGKITKIRKKEKNIFDTIEIESDQKFTQFEHPFINSKIFEKASRKDILDYLENVGLFSHIFKRPYNTFASPKDMPKAIFIKGFESDPFLPPLDLQIEDDLDFFYTGVEALLKISKNIFFTCRKKSICKAALHEKGVKIVEVDGSYPASNLSIAIERFSPIRAESDCVWTLDSLDVLIIGKMIKKGIYHTDRILSVSGGNDCLKNGYYKTPFGVSVRSLIDQSKVDENIGYLSGSIFSGEQLVKDDYLCFSSTAFIQMNEKVMRRKMFPFIRPFGNVFSSFKRIKQRSGKVAFTLNLHGEKREFLDGSVYDNVMPLKILTMPLIKELICENYEKAKKMGLLEIAEEDFAAASLICPSKINMQRIVKNAFFEILKEIEN
jgi:Na+-transporting NADH:ubiquinone oxidoreductase subunit A